MTNTNPPNNNISPPIDDGNVSVANAYGGTSGNSSTRRFVIIFCSLFAILLFRNIFFRDYTEETKSYLKGIGREDAIERIVPPTYSDVMDQKKLEKETISQLIKNITLLTTEMHGLKADVDKLQAATRDITSSISHHQEQEDNKELGISAPKKQNVSS